MLFRILKASTRNWWVSRSVMRLFLLMLKSKFTEAGSKKVFRPRFPSRNPVSGSRTVGELKQAGLKACLKSPGEMPLRASAHNKLGRCGLVPSPTFVPVSTV